jgi:adenylate kinase family enzyme
MIIMINGAFGAGKTTIADELLNIIDNSMIFDPEEVGFMLRNIITEEIKLPEEKTNNFQDIGIWKTLVVDVAKRLKRQYNKNIIVPMTIYNKEYYQYIVNGFKAIDQQTYHFCLVAKEETIHERLRKRGEIEGNWCFQQTKKCVEAFQDDCFEKRIVTDDLNVDEIIDSIVKELSLERSALPQ